MSPPTPPSGPDLSFLLSSDEPWTRYRTYRDLLDLPADAPEVLQARAEMLVHPQVRSLIETAASWPGYALKRHNDARHPLYALSTLADFGLRASDPGLDTAVEKILQHQAPEGPFETKMRLSTRFGGKDGEFWTWIACDAPTLTYALLRFGLEADPRVQKAVDHLLKQSETAGWLCSAAPELGNFHGPGRRSDPCPIANVYALKVLAQVASGQTQPAALRGTEMLLTHWERQAERKLYLFGIGTDFRKLKYPFVWYDILHVTDILSRFPHVHADPRFREMIDALTLQADTAGRYTASSMYRAWKGWSFADKKRPSPWLTFLVQRILNRLNPTQAYSPSS